MPDSFVEVTSLIDPQLAILTTNLPVSWGSSIFLKVDETRVDIIKALITGPEGTPYVFSKQTDIELRVILIPVTTMDGPCKSYTMPSYPDCQPSFLFDIFLGPSYNQSPPSVKFMTV